MTGLTDFPAVITQPRTDAKAERDLVQLVIERMAVSEKFDRPFKEACLRSWTYLNNLLPDDWPYYSKFFEPETQNASWDMIEGLMSSVFNKERPFDLMPVESQDEIQTEIMRALMDYVLREKVQYKRNLFFQVQEAVFFGNGVAKFCAEQRRQRLRYKRPMFANIDFQRIPLGVEEVMQEIVEQWPSMRVVSRFDCFPSATGSTIQEMPYFIERVIKPLDEIKAMAETNGWRNTDKLLGFMSLDQRENAVSGEFSERHFDLFERFKAIGFDVTDNGVAGVGENAVKYAELLIYSERYPDADGCGRILVVGDRKELLTDPENTDNPFYHGLKSYSDIKFSPISGQSWQSKGVPALIEPMQEKLNQRMNAIGDIIEDATKPMTLVQKSAIDDITDLEPYPRAIVEVNDLNGIKWREPMRVPPDAWSDVSMTRASLQRSGGSLDVTRGIDASQSGFGRGQDTATGISMLINAANSAKSFKWRLAEETGITEGLNIIASIIQQVMTEPQVVRILGDNRTLTNAGYKQFINVDPIEIAGRWNFFAVGASSSVDEATQAEVLTRIVTGWMQLPDVAPRVKQRDIAIEVAEKSGVRNPSRFFMSDEEFQQKQAEQPDPLAMLEKQSEIETRGKILGSIDYDTAPPDIQSQLEQLAGLQPSQLRLIMLAAEHQLKQQGLMAKQQPKQIPARTKG